MIYVFKCSINLKDTKLFAATTCITLNTRPNLFQTVCIHELRHISDFQFHIFINQSPNLLNTIYLKCLCTFNFAHARMRIKVYEFTCKRRLQWKLLIEILFEASVCQSQHFQKNLSFYFLSDTENMLVTRD